MLERNPVSPAAVLATHSLVGDWDSPAELQRLGAHCDVVTLENEFVDAAGLAALEKAGHKIFPTPQSIAVFRTNCPRNTRSLPRNLSPMLSRNRRSPQTEATPTQTGAR